MYSIQHDSSAHRFTVQVEGEQAVLDYMLSGNVMTITHTGVPQAVRRRGVAADLMRAALEAAHSAGWQVHPACSYAVAYLRRHRDDERQHEEDMLDEALEESFPASDPPSVGRVN